MEDRPIYYEVARVRAVVTEREVQIGVDVLLRIARTRMDLFQVKILPSPSPETPYILGGQDMQTYVRRS
jgi:hypothetical protein